MGVSGYLNRVNRIDIPKLDPNTKKQLMDRYREDQELLQRLCGISFD